MDDRFEPGLDPDELAEAQAHARAEARADARAPGAEIIIRHRSAELMLPIFALVLAGIVGAMGQPLIAGAFAGLVLLVLVIRESRRIGRISIGDDGSISLPGRLDADQWSSVQRITFRLRYPVGGTEVAKAAFETAEVVIETGDGRRLRLARGPLYQRSPSRARSWPWLGERMSKQARAAGLRVQGRSRQEWIATGG
ncbi:MAG: hypothetical protein H6712_27250 [Myxococcales bacterium]|nr:hypothetical protein [Myxococcales bacterium]MCB9717575.1 hypothetical protein [Myxococcales bacterium]